MTQLSRPSSGSVLCVFPLTPRMCNASRCAAVWPILEFDSANGPIHFIVANKGVGPAIIKNVIVKVDGEPVRNWREALEKILGPGEHLGSESDMRVMCLLRANRGP